MLTVLSHRFAFQTDLWYALANSWRGGAPRRGGRSTSMEIVPRVHRIPDVNGSNAVLLEGDELALVDTGIQGNGETIIRYIESLGRKPGDLKYIILSHFHFD